MRAKTLLAQLRGVALKQRMQSAPRAHTHLAHFNPVPLACKGIARQAQARARTALVQLLPIKGEPLDPKLQQLLVLTAAHPPSDRTLQLLIGRKQRERLAVALALPHVQPLKLGAA